MGISVITPEQRIGLLTGDVEGLIGSGAVNGGQGNALTEKLEAALQSLERGNVRAATNQIQAFINQVNAFVRAGTLTPEQGQSLIGAAERVITLLSS